MKTIYALRFTAGALLALLLGWPAAAQLRPATGISGLSQNITYVQAAGSQVANGNALLAANAAVQAGTTLMLGPGVFDVGSNIFQFKHHVNYVGQGMDVTIINGTNGAPLTFGPQFRPASGVIRDLKIRTRDNNVFHYGFGIGFTSPIIFTNALVENVWFEGDTDCIYSAQPFDGQTGSILFRNCKFTSGWDVLVVGGSTNIVYEFENCNFTITVSGQTNTANTLQSARWIAVQPNDGQGTTVRFKNCTYTTYNAKNPYQLYEIGFGDGPYNSVTWENCTTYHVVTNGASGVAGWYSEMSYTNLFLNFIGHNDIFVEASGAIVTNTPGPQTVTLMSSATRTNWLPPIHFVNTWTNMFGVEITVKDGAGNAGTQPIFVRGLDNATINGSVSNVITANYGVKRYRNLGTNWITIIE